MRHIETQLRRAQTARATERHRAKMQDLLGEAPAMPLARPHARFSLWHLLAACLVCTAAGFMLGQVTTNSGPESRLPDTKMISQPATNADVVYSVVEITEDDWVEIVVREAG